MASREIRALQLPADQWIAIRNEILERAKNRCEGCGVLNYSREQRPDGRWVSVALTVVHLDDDPGNNGVAGDRPNLRALCVRCNLSRPPAAGAAPRPASQGRLEFD